MGEVTNPPEENCENDDSVDNSDSADNPDFDEEEFEDDEFSNLTSQELQELDSKLDAINLALDALESKRENIHDQLLDLLKSSQEIRKELKENQAMNVDEEEQPKEQS